CTGTPALADLAAGMRWRITPTGARRFSAADAENVPAIRARHRKFCDPSKVGTASHPNRQSPQSLRPPATVCDLFGVKSAEQVLPALGADYRLNRNAGLLMRAHIRSCPPSVMPYCVRYAVDCADSFSSGRRLSTDR